MKITLLFISLFISFNLQSQERLNVVASASMIADIAKNILGDKHSIEMIVPIGGDPHLHEPTPSNAQLVAKADLILINGLTFEGWITELIENSGTEAKIKLVTEGIDVLTSQTYKNSADPHAWMDASNGIIYAENIAQAISQLDPVNKKTYDENLAHYKTKLSALDDQIEQAIASIPDAQRILITSHDAFQYYGRRYNIQLEAIMGISTEAEAQTTDITRVNRVIKEHNVPAIFIESTINPKMMQQLAKDNNIAIGGKLYADSLGDDASPASTYINMLEYNTKMIVSALTRPSEIDRVNEAEGTNYTFIILLGSVLLLLLLGVIYYLNNK